MEILGRDNWINATGDFASVTESIRKVTAEISAEYIKLNEYKRQINICGNKALGCRNKTGKSINDWRDLRNQSQDKINYLEKSLAELQKAQSTLAVAESKQSTVDVEKAKADVEKAIANTEMAIAGQAQAKGVGVWIAVGLGAIAVGALIWFKIIKKHK